MTNQPNLRGKAGARGLVAAGAFRLGSLTPVRSFPARKRINIRSIRLNTRPACAETRTTTAASSLHIPSTERSPSRIIRNFAAIVSAVVGEGTIDQFKPQQQGGFQGKYSQYSPHQTVIASAAQQSTAGLAASQWIAALRLQ